MNIWQFALLAGAGVTFLCSSGLPRARLWIFTGAASFAASVVYARYALPYPPFFNMICDTIMCLAIYFAGRLQWELAIFRVFQISILMNIFELIGAIGSHYQYIAGLEIVNWLALLLIMSVAMLQRIKANGWFSWADRFGHIRSACSVAESKRKEPPFIKAR